MSTTISLLVDGGQAADCLVRFLMHKSHTTRSHFREMSHEQLAIELDILSRNPEGRHGDRRGITTLSTTVNHSLNLPRVAAIGSHGHIDGDSSDLRRRDQPSGRPSNPGVT